MGDLNRELERALARTADAAMRRAVKLSSGTLKPADLRRLKHPYARRHGRPLQDPSVINVQTGVFRSAWRKQVTAGPDAMEAVVENVDPKARLLEQGTRLMFERPLAERVQRELEPVFQREIQEAIRRALRA